MTLDFPLFSSSANMCPLAHLICNIDGISKWYTFFNPLSLKYDICLIFWIWNFIKFPIEKFLKIQYLSHLGLKATKPPPSNSTHWRFIEQWYQNHTLNFLFLNSFWRILFNFQILKIKFYSEFKNFHIIGLNTTQRIGNLDILNCKIRTLQGFTIRQ
jgi:hypothetical protein